MSTDDINDILNDSSLTVVQKYQRIYGEVVRRDVARHRLEKLKRQLDANNAMNMPKYSKVTINSDGTQLSERLVDCSEADLKNPAFLLECHGYSMKDFELVSAQSSIWNGGRDSKVLYSSKVKVRPIRLHENVQQLVERALEVCGMATDCCEEDTFVGLVDNVGDSKKMIEVCVPDLHIGLTEVFDGKNTDTSIDFVDRFEVFMRNVERYVEKHDADVVRIAFLGDIFHYDTAGKTTTKGTQQDSHIPFSEMYDLGVAALQRFVSGVLRNKRENAVVEVVYVPGNHDTILGYTVMKVLEASLGQRLRKDLSVHIYQNSRPFRLFGKNLIGYTHGDMDKKRLTQWIYNEAREYISDAENIEIHVGHLHHEQTVEDNGVILRYLPTIAGQSPWEYKQGYNSKRKMEVFLWDSENGLEEIKYINV